jgi:hypothetical protein
VIAVTDATTVSISVVAIVLGLGLLAALRVVFRKEPAPATWKRIRLGFFIERDPKNGDSHDAQADE